MTKRFIAVACMALLTTAGPAFAQFAPAAGGTGAATSGGQSNISGAGTGLSAPATSTGSGMSNQNGIAQPTTAVPIQPVYPGVGIGGAGLPPAAVLPPGGHGTTRAAGSAATPH